MALRCIAVYDMKQCRLVSCVDDGCCVEPMQHSNPIELFQWLPKEHMCILVYLVSKLYLSIGSPPNTSLLYYIEQLVD